VDGIKALNSQTKTLKMKSFDEIFHIPIPSVHCEKIVLT
jgi:hypothetical protein